MVLSVLIVFIIIYIYLKYPHVFDFKKSFVSGKFVRLERDSGTTAINFANFIIYDDEGSVITPTELSVYPNIAYGDGRTPKARSSSDLNDVVLVETTSTSTPYVEYDLGSLKKISKVLIVNRKRTTANAQQNVNERMSKTILRILDSDRNQIFEKRITDIQDIYSINIS